MKLFVTLFFASFVFMNSFSQSAQEEEVKSTIVSFFEAFHKQDTSVMKSMVKGNIKMQSIGKAPDGKTLLNENSFDQFTKSIAGIPKEKSFEEKITDYMIKVDGDMANAWTPYEFWFDGNFSHCGVNSFQLLKESGQWKIIYLVDTRRKDNCVK